MAGLSLEDRKLFSQQREALYRCLRLVVHPGLKTINVSSLYLDPSLVKSLCSFLPELTQLTDLNLGGISCKHNNILDCGTFPGWEFQFLPNLTSVNLSGIVPEALKSLCMFCPNLLSLTLHNSEINDEIITNICCLKRLEFFSCTGDQSISPYGFAELLRNLPELRNLGSCDCFGEVLTTLYSKWSLYHRSVGSIPKILALDKIDCRGPITPQEISYINMYCPNMKSFSFAYTWRHREELNESFGNLSGLSTLSNLQELTVTSADFYSHSLFSVMRTGAGMTSLSLSNIDEMNLNSIIMIGSGCPNLVALSISCCHYAVEQGDANKMLEGCFE